MTAQIYRANLRDTTLPKDSRALITLPTDIGGLVIEGRQFAARLDNLPGFGRVLFAHKNDRSADAGKRVLNRVNGFQVRFDAGGLKQALHDDGFVLLLRIENLDEFFVRLGLGLGLRREVSRLWHVSSAKLPVNRLRQSLYLCLAGRKGVRPREA